MLVELPSRLVCINILSELKVVPDNSVAVKRNTVAIQWLVDYLWILWCSPSTFRLMCDDHRRRRRRKKIKKKKKKKKKKMKKKADANR